MILKDYLQTTYWVSRRKFTALIDAWNIFVNNKKIENYKEQVNEWDIIKIPSIKIDTIVKTNHDKFPTLLIFNKPIWYTCSKSDKYNKTFYKLLPKEFKNKYYYIWRLDKDSHWLMLLTSNPKLVNEFEHPSKEITKTYLIELDKPFNWELKNKILSWIKEWWEFLRTLSIKKEWNSKIEIVLNEWKKRHIRRIFKSLWYTVIDLKRTKIWSYSLWTLKEWEYKTV